jgi:hypothetical protein
MGGEERSKGAATEDLAEGIRDSLDAILSYIKRGQAVPDELIERANKASEAVDDREVLVGQTPLDLTLDGSSNVLDGILYRLRSGEPVDRGLRSTAEDWIRRIDSMREQAPGRPSTQSHGG